MKSPTAPILLSLVAMLTAACSSSYLVEMTLTIDDSVAIAEGDVLMMVATESAPIKPDESSADAPWGQLGDPIFLVEGERLIQDKTSVCCAPEPTVYVYAFIDQNNSGAFEAGEPYAADPRNPIKLDDDYRTELTLVAGDDFFPALIPGARLHTPETLIEATSGE